MFTRISNNTNGNPRYVIHYLQLANDYSRAMFLAKKLGGRKYVCINYDVLYLDELERYFIVNQ